MHKTHTKTFQQRLTVITPMKGYSAMYERHITGDKTNIIVITWSIGKRENCFSS